MNCIFLTFLIATSLIFAAAQNPKVPPGNKFKENVKGIKNVPKLNNVSNNQTSFNNVVKQEKNKTEINPQSGRRFTGNQGNVNNQKQQQLQKQTQNNKNNQGRNINTQTLNNKNERTSGQMKYKLTSEPTITQNQFGYTKYHPILKNSPKTTTQKSFKNKQSTVNVLRYRGMNSGIKNVDMSDYAEMPPPPKKIKTKSLRQNKPCSKLTCLMMYEVFAKEVYDQPMFYQQPPPPPPYQAKIIIKNLNIGSDPSSNNHENPEMIRELIRKVESQMTTSNPYGSTYNYYELSTRLENLNNRLEQLIRDQEMLRNQQYMTTTSPYYYSTTEMYTVSFTENEDLGALIERMRIIQMSPTTQDDTMSGFTSNVYTDITTEATEDEGDYEIIKQKTTTVSPYTTMIEIREWKSTDGIERKSSEFPPFLIPHDMTDQRTDITHLHQHTTSITNTQKYDLDITTTSRPFSQRDIITLPASSILNNFQINNTFVAQNVDNFNISQGMLSMRG